MKKSVFLDHVNTAAKQRGITLIEALQQVKQLGYDAVDCSYSAFRDDPIALRTMLNEVGLEVACVFGAFYLTDPSRNGEMVEFFDNVVLLGTKTVLIVPKVLQPGEKTPENIETITLALAYACEEAKKRGLTVTLENFGNLNSPCCHTWELRQFFDRIPDLRFTFDTGNFSYSCENELEAFAQLKDRLAHVHLKDFVAAPNAENEQPLVAIDGTPLYPAPIGNCTVKIDSCIEQVLETGYDGYFSVEQYGVSDQLDCMAKSIAYLKQLEAALARPADSRSAAVPIRQQMAVNFSRDQWSNAELCYAYTFRYTQAPTFTQADDHITTVVNPNHPEGFDNISMLTKKRYSVGVKATLHCAFEGRGCPEIILVPETEMCPDGVLRYGACFENVLYFNGINIWRHYRTDGKCHWHKRLGAEFSVSETDIHELTLEIKENYLRAAVDGVSLTLRTEDIPERFHIGFTACEGIARIYDFSVDGPVVEE